MPNTSVYRISFLCKFLLEKLGQDASPYRYMIACRDLLYSSLDLVDEELAILRLTFSTGQLTLFVDRDYFFLNWGSLTYLCKQPDHRQTIARWQLCTEFENMNQAEFESWMLSKLLSTCPDALQKDACPEVSYGVCFPKK